MAINAAVTSPADVVNLALVRIGHPLRVSNLFDGSAAAKASLDIYAQTRDELLRMLEPGFARREITLTLLKSAPPGGYVPPTAWSTAYPQLPWLFEYAYPTDCLKLGSVRATPIFLPNFDPQPSSFAIANDNALNPAQKVILTNVAGAIGAYVGQVTDPTTWGPSFVESLAAALARRLTVALADPKLLQLEAQDEQAETTIDGMIQG